MRNSGWFKNLRLKIASIVAVVVTTVGFYAVIAAHPLTHVNASSQTTAPAAAPAGNTTIAQPADGGVSAPVQQQPIFQSAPQPRLRTGGS